MQKLFLHGGAYMQIPTFAKNTTKYGTFPGTLGMYMFPGQKQRTYWVMTGSKDIEGLFNKMQISIEGLLGARFVDKQNL